MTSYNYTVTKTVLLSAVVSALKASYPAITLQAATPTDTVHGWVQVANNDNGTSGIIIYFYDTPEAPNVNHKSTLAVASPMPSYVDIQAIINTL